MVYNTYIVEQLFKVFGKKAPIGKKAPYGHLREV